jgi:hypothetical protein
LQDIILATKAKSCYIPRSNNYKPRPFAILYFESADLLNDAIKIGYAFGGNHLQWCPAESKCCHKCGSPDHIVIKCPQLLPSNDEEPSEPKRQRSHLPSVQKLYNKFKPAGSRSLILKSNTDTRNTKGPTRDPNLNYSDALSGNNKGKGKDTGPNQNSLDHSIHNPNSKNSNNDTNQKLYQILNMLSNMQKAMSDLEICINKLKRS